MVSGWLFVFVCVSSVARAHLQTPVTLCREQSIRGYVSKVRKVTRTDNSYFLTLLT